MLANLLTLLTFLGIALVVYFTGSAALNPRENRLLARLFGGTEPDDDPLSDIVIDRIESRTTATKLDREILRAGWYAPTARRDFVSARNTAVMFAIIVTGVIAFGLVDGDKRRMAQTVILGIAAVIICWAVPRLYLRTAARRRVQRIRRALPDALDLLSMCLTGGLSLTESFAHVSREIEFAHKDLALELMIVKRQTELRSSDFAFDQFAKRIDAPEVITLASLIVHGQRLGTDVVTSIREYADNIRLRRRQQADERSNKAGVKMLFPLTMCLLPSVFIILWGPSVLELWIFLQGLSNGGSP